MGFACPSQLARQTLPRCLFVFLRSRVCLRPFRSVPCGSNLAVRLRLPSSAPSGTLIPIEPAPAGHTSADVPVCGFREHPCSQTLSGGPPVEHRRPTHPNAGSVRHAHPKTHQAGPIRPACVATNCLPSFPISTCQHFSFSGFHSRISTFCFPNFCFFHLRRAIPPHEPHCARRKR